MMSSRKNLKSAVETLPWAKTEIKYRRQWRHSLRRKWINPLRFLSRRLSRLKDSYPQKSKMMTQDKDNELKAFFHGMKEKDREILIPEFPVIVKSKSLNWWIPLGIAASLLLGFFLLPKKIIIADPPAEVIIITLQQGVNQEQQILIEEKTYLETWESPTSSLLAEY